MSISVRSRHKFPKNRERQSIKPHDISNEASGEGIRYDSRCTSSAMDCIIEKIKRCSNCGVSREMLRVLKAIPGEANLERSWGYRGEVLFLARLHRRLSISSGRGTGCDVRMCLCLCMRVCSFVCVCV